MIRRTWLLFALAVAGCSSSEPAPGADPGPDAGAAGDGGDDGADDGCPTATDTLPASPKHTPRWALRPWISKDISSADDTRDFLEGFRSRDIPVGAVVLDSPWETHYNTFVPHPQRYPAFGDLVKELHDADVRVVLWMTQMVNRQSFDLETGGDTYQGASPNYDLPARCGFFVDEGATYGWWKGSGSGIDFLNPRAAAWWHGQQDLALDLGIDGWKLDFGDSYVRSEPVHTAAGDVPHQTYSEAYYHDFLAHGVARRGRDFTTMVRAWDVSYDFEGRFFAKKDDAPVAWMGDNRRDWFGLADALRETFVSARAGYLVVGSDVGGYLDHDDTNLTGPVIPFDTLVFARWTAIGALSPFMQLHGRANIAPWTVPDHADETVALYRYWSKLHDALVPFFYSLAEEGWASGAPIVRPIGEPADWEGDFRYLLGDALLVAPILDASGTRSIDLPAGARWLDWWSPGGDAIAGGTRIDAWDASDRARIPLFLREGAIVPLDVIDDANGLGTAASKGALTVLAWPGAAPSSFAVHEDEAVVHVDASSGGGGAEVTLRTDGGAALPRAIVLAVRTDAKPGTGKIDSTSLAWVADRAALEAATEPSAWWDASRRATWVRVAAGPAPVTLTLAP